MMGRGPNPRGAKIGKRLQEPLALPFLWEYEIAIPVMLHLAETFSFADTWPSTREIAEDEGMDRKTGQARCRMAFESNAVKDHNARYFERLC